MAHHTHTHNDALSEGFAVDSETSATTPVARPWLPFAHPVIITLNDEITSLMGRIDGYEKDMASTLEHIEELKSSLRMMTEIADVAARDADKHGADVRDLSRMLESSGKREDRMHETLMGVRALAESNALTDHEKVALILRLA